MQNKNDKQSSVPLWQLLVELGMAADQKQAQGFVMAGQVVVDDQRIDKPNTLVSTAANVRLKGQSRFVSRAGEKLFRWADSKNLLSIFKDASVLDVGSSTGGFTDVALRYGCDSVCCVDVGTNQLAWKIRSDARVDAFEKTDIQDFDPKSKKFSLVVMDISFQSISRVLDHLPWQSFDSHCQFVFLVKPQFELSSTKIPQGGVVVDSTLHEEAVDIVTQSLLTQSLEVVHASPSPVLGRTGNQEFFLFCRRS